MDDHEHTWVTNGCGGFCTGMRDERRHCMEKLERDECNRRLQSHDRLVEALDDLAALAEHAMNLANRDDGEFNIDAELKAARAALAAARGEGE